MVAQTQKLITMDLNDLTQQAFASYNELNSIEAIKKKFDLGKNEFGFRERVIIDSNNNQWDYIPEDGIYELRNSTESKYLQML